MSLTDRVPRPNPDDALPDDLHSPLDTAADAPVAQPVQEPLAPQALCELLEPLISAAIARKARQRRYIP